jgi:methylenetetrahydrofolate reductase (NADPH)
VNVVHNDFMKPDAIFEPFMKAGAEMAAAAATVQVNGKSVAAAAILSVPAPVMNGSAH